MPIETVIIERVLFIYVNDAVKYVWLARVTANHFSNVAWNYRPSICNVQFQRDRNNFNSFIWNDNSVSRVDLLAERRLFRARYH